MRDFCSGFFTFNLLNINLVATDGQGFLLVEGGCLNFTLGFQAFGSQFFLRVCLNLSLSARPRLIILQLGNLF